MIVSQTQIFKSPRLCDHVPMQYVPKTVYDNTPKIHKHVTTPISQTPITIFKTLNHNTKPYNLFQTLPIIFILQNIIIISIYSKVLKSSKTDIFSIQLVQIYKTTYIFCKSIIHKNNSFSVSRIVTLAVQI
jgi:hypothetical protein